MNEKKLKTFQEIQELPIDELENYIELIKKITNEKVKEMSKFRMIMTQNAKKLFLERLQDVLKLYEYLFGLQHVLINKLTGKNDN